MGDTRIPERKHGKPDHTEQYVNAYEDCAPPRTQHKARKRRGECLKGKRDAAGSRQAICDLSGRNEQHHTNTEFKD